MKDLNLLPVFEALWTEKSVTRAGERLGVSQAAISASLKRMRLELNDKLFTLVGRRMEPTPLAASIAPEVLQALAIVRTMEQTRKEFDPAVEVRTFTIRTRDVGEVVCLPSIIGTLNEVAPGIQLKTIFQPLDETILGMANGSIDMSLGVLPDLEVGIHKRPLFEQHYVCVVRHGHPLEHVDLTLDVLRAQYYLLVEYSGSGHAVIERELLRLCGRESIKLRIPQYLSAPHFITTTDYLWIAPAILVEKLSAYYPMTAKPLPMEFPNFEVALYWHERFHKDLGNMWLRDFIATHLRM